MRSFTVYNAVTQPCRPMSFPGGISVWTAKLFVSNVRTPKASQAFCGSKHSVIICVLLHIQHLMTIKKHKKLSVKSQDIFTASLASGVIFFGLANFPKWASFDLNKMRTCLISQLALQGQTEGKPVYSCGRQSRCSHSQPALPPLIIQFNLVLFIQHF